MNSHVGHLVSPIVGQFPIILPAGQFVDHGLPARSVSRSGRSFPPFPSILDLALAQAIGSQIEVSAQFEELRMKAGVPARAADHRGFQVVEDDLPRAAAEELQGIDDAPIEIGLASRTS